jgi:hypothetical protein
MQRRSVGQTLFRHLVVSFRLVLLKGKHEVHKSSAPWQHRCRIKAILRFFVAKERLTRVRSLDSFVMPGAVEGGACMTEGRISYLLE